MDGLTKATPQSKFRYALAIFTVVVLLGTAGYQLIEGWSFLESAYMALITVTTVGFGEVHALSPQGRMFTIFLLLFGVGAASYTAFSAAEVLVDRQMRAWFKGDKMSSKIEKLRDHIILCGYGRVGCYIAVELKQRGASVVVIEKDPDKVSELKEDLVIVG